MILDLIVLAFIRPPDNPHLNVVDYVEQRAQYTPKQFKCLYKLIDAESEWNTTADNPTSTAYGLFQQLKLDRERPTVSRQTTLGLRYITHRYGTACSAWKHKQREGWY